VQQLTVTVTVVQHNDNRAATTVDSDLLALAKTVSGTPVIGQVGISDSIVVERVGGWVWAGG
jgi:hypothetical protein